MPLIQARQERHSRLFQSPDKAKSPARKAGLFLLTRQWRRERLSRSQIQWTLSAIHAMQLLCILAAQRASGLNDRRFSCHVLALPRCGEEFPVCFSANLFE
jgi:hypothetical protein